MNELERTAEFLRREIEASISSVGVLARVFGRGKSTTSIQKKLTKDPNKYSIGGKLIQDGIGIRVALYFEDDIAIVEALLKLRYQFLPGSSSIDGVDESTFNVLRRNLVFRLPGEQKYALERMASVGMPLDTTFEIQIRTVLSEGWHEVEHDLRYKCRSSWSDHADLNRALNGVMATLETSEWSMLKIFDELAFRHYKAQRWAAMSHAKLRIRAEPVLSVSIATLFNAESALPKAFYKFDRSSLLKCLVHNRIFMPVTVDNMVFLWNWIGPREDDLVSLMPEPIRDAFQEI